MSKTEAIALCRVSSSEQLENNSLNRQRESINRAARELGVVINDAGWWSGHISSKKGTNLERPDLLAMLKYCKNNKAIKYLIVDRPDRFMRSIDEAIYYEVEFKKLGVKVWYASDKELNTEVLMSKFLKFTKYFSAEGSNDDRVEQSIGGQTAALRAGKYPFAPKPGYKKGYERAVQEIDELKGPILKEILEKLVNRLITPSQALVELNQSEFVNNHSLYKMDKFRRIITDPFYAGIVEVNKQVKVRNESGLHTPLITIWQHQELLRIMSDKKKNQAGPIKGGNQKYPLSNLVSCSNCRDESNGRLVGLDLHNGKNRSKKYEKYRCRSCKKYFSKEEVHSGVLKEFKKHTISEDAEKHFIKALRIVWKKNEEQVELESMRIQHRIKSLESNLTQNIEAAINPANSSISEDILNLIDDKKDQINKLTIQLEELQSRLVNEWEEFLNYSFDFIRNMGPRFLDSTKENRLRCKQLIFPSGFYIDTNKKVYTLEKSPLISLIPKKKDTEVSEDSLLVDFYNEIQTHFSTKC